jgi:hypothetical protein
MWIAKYGLDNMGYADRKRFLEDVSRSDYARSDVRARTPFPQPFLYYHPERTTRA